MPGIPRAPWGGCFGQRVDQLVRACGWTRREADIAFGFTGGAGWASPVERVRRGGHAAPKFVTRLGELEREYGWELRRLEAIEKGDVKRLREINRVLGARELRRRAAVAAPSSVLAEGASVGAGKFREVLHLDREGRVVSRESLESWVARHAPAGGGAPADDPPAEGEV